MVYSKIVEYPIKEVSLAVYSLSAKCKGYEKEQTQGCYQGVFSLVGRQSFKQTSLSEIRKIKR